MKNKKSMIQFLIFFNLIFILSMSFICAVSEQCADVNNDEMVNLRDLNLVRSKLNSFGCNDGNSWCNNADLNKDGVVDEKDLTMIRENFNQKCSNDEMNNVALSPNNSSENNLLTIFIPILGAALIFIGIFKIIKLKRKKGRC